MISRAEKLRNQLMDMIGKNQEELLQILKQIFARTDQSKSVFAIISQVRDFANDQISGVLNTENITLRKNQINNSLRMLIGLIDEDINRAYELENAIFNRLLVVCKSPEREDYLKRLLPAHRYKEVEYDHSLQPSAKEYIDTFDLIVFDNLPYGTKDEQKNAPDLKDLLSHYLENAKPYILYLGPFIPFINDYPEKVYASNSVFSIHARIKEMVTFIKYDQDAP